MPWAAFIAWSLAAGVGAAVGGVDLRPHPAAGRESFYLQTESGTITSEVGPNEQRTRRRTDEVGWTFRARGVEAKGATIEARIAYLRFRFESDRDAYDRDTRRPESLKPTRNGPGPEYLQLVDRPITITLDANGRVTKVAGADELLTEASEGVPVCMHHMMSADAIRRWPLFAPADAPPEASAGATWETPFTTDYGFVWLRKRQGRARFTLARVDDSLGRAEVSVVYDVQPEPPPTQPSVAEPAQQTTDWKGTILWDMAGGRLIRAVSRLRASDKRTFFGNINTSTQSDVTFTFEQVDRSTFNLPGATTTTSQPAAPATIDLSTRFQQGQALDYKIVESVHANLRAGTGADKPIYFFREMGLALSALKVGPDGSAELNVSFVSPNSESVQVMAMPQGSPQALPDVEAPVVPGLTLGQYEQEPRHTAASMLKRLPLFAGATAPKPVAVGAKWGDVAEIIVPLVGKVAVDTQYELKAVDSANHTAQLGIVQELSLMELPADSQTGSAPHVADFSGNLTGVAEWDLARGHCIAARLTGTTTSTRKASTGESVTIEETIELTMQRVRLAMPQTRPASTQPALAATAPAETGQDARPPKSEPALSEVGPDGSSVIAYVGSRPLTVNQLNDEMARLLKNRPTPTVEVGNRLRRQARSVMLLRMAYENYLAEHPELVTPADLDKAVGQTAEIAKQQGRDLQEMMRDEGVTEAGLREQFRIEVAQEKLLSRASDPQRVAEFYNAHRGEFDGSTVVTRQIQYAVDPLLTPPAECDLARARLAAIRGALDAGGLTFEQAMQQVSQDPLLGRIGQAPGFPRYGDAPEPLAAAAFGLQTGQIAGPIESSDGCSLIQMMVHMPGEPLTLEKATPLIVAYLQGEDAQAFLRAELARHPIRWMAAASGKVPGAGAPAGPVVPASGPATVEPVKPAASPEAARPRQVPATQPVTCSPVVTGADGTLVLAYVGEQAITQGEVDAEILRAGKEQWPDPATLQNLRQQILADFVVRRVYERYAAEHPGLVTDADIDATIRGATQYAKGKGTSIEQVMQESGRTMEELRRQAVPEIAREKMQAQVADDAHVTAFYEAHKDGFDGTLVTAKHILIQVHPFLARPEDNDAAKAKLAGSKADIDAGKLTFDQAIERYSEDPARRASKTLPPFPRYGRMAEAFAAAAFALQPGQISDPVRTAHGWHLIQVVARAPGPLPTQSEINAIIRKRLYDQAFEDLLASQQITPLIVYVQPPQE